MRRIGRVVTVLAVAGVAVACQGVPRTDFNGGAPVAVRTTVDGGGVVLRAADGSTFVSRMQVDSLQGELVKLRPDGTTDTAYGSGGSAVTGLSAPAEAGVARPDGSVLLHGDLTYLTPAIVRVGPSGQVDTSYGDGGAIVRPFGQQGIAACDVQDAGTVTCATWTKGIGLDLDRFDLAGDAVAAPTVPLDFEPFTRPGPSGTVSTTLDIGLTDIEQEGDAVVASFEVTTAWLGESGYPFGYGTVDLVVVRIEGAAPDEGFGAGGYALVGGERFEGSGGAWPAPHHTIDVAADGSVTFSYGAVLGRLDGAGALDPAWGDDGIVTVRDPDGAVVEQRRFATRDGNAVTVAGRVGGDVVVLRYTATGELDPAFSDDGMAVLDSTDPVPVVGGLDVNRGTVTVSYEGTDSTTDLQQDTFVSLLYG